MHLNYTCLLNPRVFLPMSLPLHSPLSYLAFNSCFRCMSDQFYCFWSITSWHNQPSELSMHITPKTLGMWQNLAGNMPLKLGNVAKFSQLDCPTCSLATSPQCTIDSTYLFTSTLSCHYHLPFNPCMCCHATIIQHTSKRVGQIVASIKDVFLCQKIFVRMKDFNEFTSIDTPLYTRV